MTRILLLTYRLFGRPSCSTLPSLLPRGGRAYSKHGLTDLKGRKVAAQNWLIRQSKDPYVRRAREESFRCRSAFKLLELDDKYDFLHPGQVVIDLGAAPGSWSQVTVNRVNAMNVDHTRPVGRVISVDLQHMLRVEGATVLPLTDFTLPATQASLLHTLNQLPGPGGALLPAPYPPTKFSHAPSPQTVGSEELDSINASVDRILIDNKASCDTISQQKDPHLVDSDAIGQNKELAPSPTQRRADVLLSDMAPPPSGVKSLDHQQIIQLAGAVLRFSLVGLAGGGTCLVKVWRGPEMDRLVGVMGKCFGRVQAVKPAASRADSAEMFILAQDFKL